MKVHNKPYIYIIIAALFSGLNVFGGQIFINLNISSYQISLLSMLIVALILFPIVIIKKECRVKKEYIFPFLLFGLIGSVSVTSPYIALAFSIPVSVVTFFLYAQPLWTTLFGTLLFKEKITKRKLIAMIFVVCGIFLMLNPFNNIINYNLIGMIFALIGGVGFSFWILSGRFFPKLKIHTITKTFGYGASTLFFLFLFYPIFALLSKTSGILSKLTLVPILYLILYNIFARIIVYILYFKSAKKVSSVTSGIIFLLEPISATILAFIFLEQAITINILVGGLLIIIANYILLHNPIKTFKY